LPQDAAEKRHQADTGKAVLPRVRNMSVIGKARKIQKQALEVYRQNQSVLQTVRYLTRYVVRRGPIVVQRMFTSNRPALCARNGLRSELRVAILLLGGIGDHIVAARFIRDLQVASGPFEFDAFSATPGVAKWIFSSFDKLSGCFYDTQFDGASESYDTALIISNFIDVPRSNINESPSDQKVFINKTIERITKFNTTIPMFQQDRLIMRAFVDNRLQFKGFRRSNALHGMAGLQYGGDELPLELDSKFRVDIANLRGPYITVHNGFELQNITSGLRATKCYPHFDRVVTILKRRFGDLSVVQIGTKTSVPISNVDLNLIDKTTLPQASAIIKGAICHLDNESGMVHIASCLATPCCVVFGPTPADYFGYETNINIRPQQCGDCWWITDNWMDRCPRGFDEPICTFMQSPEGIAETVTTFLRKKGLVGLPEMHPQL
jgi:hypothetical protein